MPTRIRKQAAERRISAGDNPDRIVARRFAGAPDSRAASVLLDEIAAPATVLSAFATDAPIAVYGAGNLGRMAREFLDTVGRPPGLVVDRNARAMSGDPAWTGHTVLAPEDVPEDVRRNHVLLVTVATAPYAPLEGALREMGFRHVVPFYDFAEGFRAVHPLSNGWFAPPFAALDLGMIRRALDGFGDDVSRAHHIQFLAWRRLRQEWTFDGAPVSGSDRFFIPEVLAALGDDETFIDAGAHHGSVIEGFATRVADRFRGIVAIEPDTANRARLLAFLDREMPGDTRIGVVGHALGSAAGTAAFHAGLGYASQIAPSGRDTVTVATLDALGPASFVKLHLEGAELDALRGGRDMLLRDRPIVAATVYHNDDGLWRTPLWLMDTLPRYRFLFRLHSWCGTGAVLYALPEERCR